jgi:hypothetical protein
LSAAEIPSRAADFREFQIKPRLKDFPHEINATSGRIQASLQVQAIKRLVISRQIAHFAAVRSYIQVDPGD